MGVRRHLCRDDVDPRHLRAIVVRRGRLSLRIGWVVAQCILLVWVIVGFVWAAPMSYASMLSTWRLTTQSHSRCCRRCSSSVDRECVPPLAAVLRGVVPETELQQLEMLTSDVERSGISDIVNQRRIFGDTVDADGGHEVTYLNQHAPRSVVDLLWGLGIGADVIMPTWGIKRRLKALGKPALRCLESISYYVKAHQTAAARRSDVLGDPNSLGWHNDGATLFTVVVAMGTAGSEFIGGELEIRNLEGRVHRIEDLRRGDAVVWRGWDTHRVLPVTQGRRNVVVAEWWLGPNCSRQDLRPLDDVDTTRQTLSLDPVSVVLNALLADCLTERGEWTPAEHSWSSVREIDPTDRRAPYHIACLKQTRGDLEGAAESFMDALRIDPMYADAHNRLGMVCFFQGDLAEAEMSYRRALQIDPEHADCHHNVGAARGMRGDVTGAESSFAMALSLDPAHVGAYYNLGNLQAKRGALSKASDNFRAGLQLDPQNVLLHYSLGTVSAHEGDLVAALESFQSALEIDPFHDDARHQLQTVMVTLERTSNSEEREIK